MAPPGPNNGIAEKQTVVPAGTPSLIPLSNAVPLCSSLDALTKRALPYSSPRTCWVHYFEQKRVHLGER
jgi:hypothetical protein